LEGALLDGRYEIEEKLGQGGMGIVFRCYDRSLELPVAIKVLFPNTPDQVIKRFHTEARALAQLRHPNILTVQHFGQASDGRLYLVMDFIKGESLSTLIENRGPQTFFDILPTFEKICRGLRFAHMNNVLHRDIKPSNVMIGEDPSADDSVKLVDFGLAKQTDRNFDLTKTGSAMGSPPYMSPEAVNGKESDQRSDIYSLGCTLFEMVAGRPPFQGENQFHTMMAQVNMMPPSLSETSGKIIDAEVEDFVHKCLMKNPDDRFQSMDELLAELARIKRLLMERREASLRDAEDNRYASGTFIADKTSSADSLFKRKVKTISIVAGIVLVGLAAVALLPHEKKDAKKQDKSLVELDRAENQFEKEQQKIDKAGQARKSGASLIPDETSPDQMCWLYGEMTDEEFEKALEPYAHMKAFRLQNLSISLDASNRLYHMPIENLALVDMNLSAKGIEDLSKLRRLKRLRISYCGDLPVGSIEKFKDANLEAFDFEPGKTYDRFGPAVVQLQKLRSITIRNGRVRRTDLDAIISKLNLGMLNFDGCTIESDAFRNLKLARQCTFFSCVNTELSDKQFTQISEIPNLVALDLHGTNVDDGQLKKFHQCKGLQVLVIIGTAVTERGVAYLRASVPGLRPDRVIMKPAEVEPF